MKHRNSFSLIEIVTAIAIITLCIIALLSTYYSIYRLQNMVMYNNILQKKAETLFFTKIYPNIDNIYSIKDLLNEDIYLNTLIQVNSIKVIPATTEILTINISKDNGLQTLHKQKKGITIKITYTILKTKEQKDTEIFLPVVINFSAPSNPNSDPRWKITRSF